MTTVSIETITPHLLLMGWGHQPKPNDINQAFNQIIHILNDVEMSVDIIVDIRANPHFPMHLTVQRAFATNQHPMMGDWLVVGQSPTAKIISRLITTLNRDNIHWFDTLDAVYARLKARTSA